MPPLQSRRFGIWLALLIASLLVAGWRLAVTDWRPRSPSQGIDLDRRIDELAHQRDLLDETIWRPERQSHDYERTIVALWDDLLRHNHDWNVFQKLGVERLVLPSSSGTEAVGNGIDRLVLSGPTIELRQGDITAYFSGLQKDGYRLVQSEWHHERFEPPGDQGAVSIINLTLHVKNEGLGRRFDIIGKVKVNWSPAPDTHGLFRPVSVDATGVNVLQADRPASFVAAFEKELETISTAETHNDLLVWDLNGDGLPEIAYPRRNQVVWNRGEFRFEAAELCREPPPDPAESLFVDLDGNGRVELLCVVPEGAGRWKFLVYSAAEAGTFELTQKLDVGEIALNSPDTVTPGDIDGDGDLDLWVTQYKQAYLGGQMPTPYYDANDGWPAYLLINQGDGRFADETEQRRLGKLRNRRAYRSSFWDYDEDGDADLLVVSDFSGVDLHQNDGQGRFTNVTSAVLDERGIFGMSHLLDDFNADGKLDLYVTGMASTTARRLEALGLGREDFPKHQEMRPVMGYGNRLYLQQPGHKFSQPSFGIEVARAGWSWGCGSLDWNLDGFPEIYVANGNRSGESVTDYCTRFWCHDVYSNSSANNEALEELFRADAELVGQQISWNGYEHNRFFVNRAGQGFVNTAFLEGVALEEDSRQVVASDFNLDGRPDLLVGFSRRDGRKPTFVIRVLENKLETGNHWIGIRLTDVPGYRLGGTTVTLHTSHGPRRAIHVHGDSFASQHPPTLHFGLGELSEVASVEVRWANGGTSQFNNPTCDQYHSIPGTP
jgi:hypothetical protein